MKMPKSVPVTLRILLLGQGGREHALAWRLGQSSQVERIYISPGNAATGNLAKTFNTEVATEDADFSTLLEFVRKNNVNFVIPSREQHLAAGIVDICNKGKKQVGAKKFAINESWQLVSNVLDLRKSRQDWSHRKPLVRTSWSAIIY
jgi:hypothetical protein